MWNGLRRWIEERAARRRRCRVDARTLAAIEERTAYYEAQRRGQHSEFLHWAKVAAEIARIAPRAEMDFRVVTAIVDAEFDRHGQGSP